MNNWIYLALFIAVLVLVYFTNISSDKCANKETVVKYHLTYLMRCNNCGKEMYIDNPSVNPALNWHMCENGEEGILLPVRKEYIK